uniref:Uncharacterized protein n=1 Tax=Leersia perrieri TaxID=77586 RepID=A0A0D9XIP6_9ORYZ
MQDVAGALPGHAIASSALEGTIRITNYCVITPAYNSYCIISYAGSWRVDDRTMAS